MTEPSVRAHGRSDRMTDKQDQQNNAAARSGTARERRTGPAGTRVHPVTPEAAQRALAMMHREMLGEWRDVGCPPLCDMCGGFYDSRGGWMKLPTCATSPLSHDEVCVPRVYRGQVCPSCEVALNTPEAQS